MGKKSGQVSRPNVVDMRIRLPAEVKGQIEALAKTSGASMNGEIVSRLERSLEVESDFGDPASRRMFLRFQDQVSRMEAITGKSWLSDLATNEAVRRLIDHEIILNRPPVENEVEINAAWEKFRERQIEAYSHARVLERMGAIARARNALLASIGPTDDPLDYMAHSYTYDPNGYGGVLGQTFSDEHRRVMAAVDYFGLRLAVDFSKPFEDWQLDSEDDTFGEATAEAAHFYLRLLPGHVEKAVQARTVFREAFSAKASALATGKLLSDSTPEMSDDVA